MNSLYDSRFQKRYAVYGRFRPLIPLLNIRLFPRNFLDKLFLYIQSFWPIFKKDQNRFITSLYKKFNNDLNGFLLFDTSWYKESQYIGLVQSKEKISFVKIFKNNDQAILQYTQAKFIEQYFSNFFSFPTSFDVFENVFITDYILRKRSIDIYDQIAEKLLYLNENLTNSANYFKHPSEIVPLDFALVLNDQPFLVEKIKLWLDKQSEKLAIIPIHGDVTPWNMFVDYHDRIILVDYESSGWHVPFYDYFHFGLQKTALKQKAPSIRKLVDQGKDIYLCLYLIDQIYKHYAEIKEHGFNDKPLQNLVTNKTKWLMELLSE